MATLSVHDLTYHDRGPFSFHIAAGECVSLTGPSGTGKTLLLRAIADLDPHQGDASLDNQTCSAMPAPQWRRLVGLLPAKSVWWFDTVGEHFNQPFIDEHLQWLEALGFQADVMKWTVSRLSTGEQQRLSLLRMLQNQPRALLLDEPTASLDTQNVSRMEALLTDYRQAQQCPVIWVTHDKNQAKRIAQRHLVLKDNGLQDNGLQDIGLHDMGLQDNELLEQDL